KREAGAARVASRCQRVGGAAGAGHVEGPSCGSDMHSLPLTGTLASALRIVAKSGEPTRKATASHRTFTKPSLCDLARRWSLATIPRDKMRKQSGSVLKVRCARS